MVGKQKRRAIVMPIKRLKYTNISPDFLQQLYTEENNNVLIKECLVYKILMCNLIER